MNLDDLPPPEVMWAGKYVRALKRGKWEYASRANDINAVVILAEYDGKVILIDGRVAMVGSYNIDPRSEYLNTEVMAIAEDEALARGLQQRIEHHIGNTWPIQIAPQAPVLRALAIQALMPLLEHQLGCPVRCWLSSPCSRGPPSRTSSKSRSPM